MSPSRDTRWSRTFGRLRERDAAAFVPFLMLGDPDPETCVALADELVASGADALELGFPFSDPVADGPAVQKAALRARAAGVRIATCFELVHEIRRRHPELPLNLLVYANLAVQPGFYGRAAAAGADTILVADLPVAEAEPFLLAAEGAGIAPVLLAAPNASEETSRRIAQACRGYTYVLGRPGVTGAEKPASMPDPAWLATLREAGAPPLLLGFGISSGEQVRNARRAGLDGVIVGSAFAQRIEAHLGAPQDLLRSVKELARELARASHAT